MTSRSRIWIAAGGLLLGVFLALLWFRMGADKRNAGSTRPPALDPAAARQGTPQSGKGQIGSTAPRPAAAGVPRFVVEEAAEPRWKPIALLAYRAQRHNWDARTPVHFFQQETRTEPWAGQMEATLQGRFSDTVLRALNIPGLRVDRVDCRTSSCALEISWDQQDQLSAQSQGERVRLDPLGLITTSTGPLAASEFRERPRPGDTVVPNSWSVRRREDGRLAVRDVVLFGDRDVQPENYGEWVDRLAASMRSAPDLVR